MSILSFSSIGIEAVYFYGISKGIISSFVVAIISLIAIIISGITNIMLFINSIVLAYYATFLPIFAPLYLIHMCHHGLY